MLIFKKSKLFGVLKNFNKGKKPQEEVSFLKNMGTLLETKQDALINFRSNTFPIKSDTTPREK